MTEPLLRCEQMSMRFGGLTAVSGLDLLVADGAIHSVIGPNGAGKTTVFNCITQNLRPTDGTVWFDGQRIDGLTPDRVAAAGISRTYQNIRLFRNISAIENLLIHRRRLALDQLEPGTLSLATRSLMRFAAP